MNDENLAILLKLCNGNKDEAYQLVETVRNNFPNKSMAWCVQKAIYDLRFGKKSLKPNPTLNRWGEGGGNFPSSPSPLPSLSPAAKVSPQLPPPPPPNFAPSTPKPKPIAIPTLSELEALAKAKKRVRPQPANAATKHRLNVLTKDERVSQRLVSRIKLNNPDRSEQWAYEKAIYEVERDRL